MPQPAPLPQYNPMSYHLKVLIYGSHKAQRQMIERRGWSIWEEICDTVPINQPFRPSEITPLHCLAGMKESTQQQYIKTVLKNVEAEWQHIDETPPIVQMAPGLWRFTTAGETKP